MSDDHDGLPGRVRAELTRLRAERQVYTVEQDRLKALLAASEQLVRELREAQPPAVDPGELAAKVAEIGELTALADSLAAAKRAAEDRAAALASDVDTVRRERDLLRRELAACRSERDGLRLRLLEAELALSADPLAIGPPDDVAAVDAQRAALAEHRAGELARELAATRETVSWRVTKPLRAVRRKIGQP